MNVDGKVEQILQYREEKSARIGVLAIAFVQDGVEVM